jgi:hypothetical protein
MIYFVESDGLIKIGFSKRPNKRLDALQESNPHDLIMRLVLEGGIEDESMYHNKFNKNRFRGEWFVFSDEIRDFIKSKGNEDLRYDLGLLDVDIMDAAETTKLRNQLRLTLRDVGEKLGMTAQSVKETEGRELIGTITLNRLKKYARALGYKLSYKFIELKEGEEPEEILGDE